METQSTISESIPADILADGDAVTEPMVSGRVLDPEIARRIDSRAERIVDTMRRTQGIEDTAVETIRELRDERSSCLTHRSR